MEQIRVKLTGIKPLLMHAIPMTLGQKGRGKQIPEPQDEAEAGLYKDKDGNIVMPAINILSCLRKAAVDFKAAGKGRKTYRDYIFSGVEITPDEVPLGANGRNPAESWVVDIKPARVQSARILRARPRFDEWDLEFTLVITDPILRPEIVKEMLEAAGNYVGLCDHRPLYGRFRVDDFQT